jgi:hypothetical protein
MHHLSLPPASPTVSPTHEILPAARSSTCVSPLRSSSSHHSPAHPAHLPTLPARRLKAHSPKAGARAVILSPTRELALQTHKVVRELGKTSDLRTAVLVGGDAMEAQFAELANNPDIMVATPGGGHMAPRAWQ